MAMIALINAGVIVSRPGPDVREGLGGGFLMVLLITLLLLPFEVTALSWFIGKADAWWRRRFDSRPGPGSMRSQDG